MADLRLAMAFMMLLSVASFLVVRRILMKAGPRILDSTAVLLVLTIGGYIRFVWGQLWIVRWIPISSVLVLANWYPVFLGMLAAVFWLRMRSESVLRRIPVQLLLMAATVWSEIYVFPRRPPECEDMWTESTATMPFRICRQSTPWTCSAASAATVLDALGIHSTEKEMAELCLTGEGTTWLGLYHGLSVRLRETGFGVDFFEGSLSDLDEAAADYPVLLCCKLTDEMSAAYPHYQANSGWIPGIAHTTVLFGRVEGVYAIGDPSQTFLELWTEEDIRHLWTGQGLRIVAIAP